MKNRLKNKLILSMAFLLTQASGYSMNMQEELSYAPKQDDEYPLVKPEYFFWNKGYYKCRNESHKSSFSDNLTLFLAYFACCKCFSCDFHYKKYPQL